ncbi:hypothetical protein AO364_1375 [Moraxella catarrhalis]|nr:hypothetical protein AO364_1375 [Moraxella catarrhalis]
MLIPQPLHHLANHKKYRQDALLDGIFYDWAVCIWARFRV